MESEQDRFMRLAYPRTLTAARRAFWSWHPRKKDDAIQECLAKMWDSYSRLLKRGKNPEPMISGLIKFAILWVRYDRRVSITKKAKTPDVFDFRSGFKRQMLSDQGEACPTDRSDPLNGSIDWTFSGGENPADVVMALEATGLSLADYYAA
jgi:hypothetical protein